MHEEGADSVRHNEKPAVKSMSVIYNRYPIPPEAATFSSEPYSRKKPYQEEVSASCLQDNRLSGTAD
jgi:hypothetical protein